VSAALALPVSGRSPRDGEAIESWLEHLADANGLTTAATPHRSSASDGVSTRYLTLAPGPGTIRALAGPDPRVRPRMTFAATTLAAYDGTALDLTGLDVNDRHSYRQVAARGWAPRPRNPDPAPPASPTPTPGSSAWRLLIVTACSRHTVAARRLGARPASGRFVTNATPTYARVGAVPTLRSNPLGAGPTRQCQHELTTITPATPLRHGRPRDARPASTAALDPSITSPVLGVQTDGCQRTYLERTCGTSQPCYCTSAANPARTGSPPGCPS
jgi:hypothetical protein